MNLDHLPPEKRDEAAKLLGELVTLYEENPLYRLDRRNKAQIEFLEARTRIIAAFAGNRFGKSTALIVKALCQVLPREFLPEWMWQFKIFDESNRRHPFTMGRIVTTTFQNLETIILPELQKWVPQKALKGEQWGRAWSKQLSTLTFKDGSFIEFRTYQQDAMSFAGGAFHFTGYDEPPPFDIRRECQVRHTSFPGAFEMFAMTPLGANSSWVRREIYRKRESPDITVIRGGMRDNPLLEEKDVEYTLSQQPDAYRAAVEFGDFIDVGGLVYPEFERCVSDLCDGKQWEEPNKYLFDSQRNPSPLDVIVGIDPGIRNCGIVWVGFDDDNVAYVFDEALLQNQTATEYAETIKKVNARWGIREALYVVDPAARQRAQVNSDTVQTELLRRGIPTTSGQNDVEAGCMQVLTRLKHKRLVVNTRCRGLRDEADDYALEPREDGVFKPLKGNDHRLDALRYALMQRPWDMVAEERDDKLGFQEGVYDPSWENESLFAESPGPMGGMY